MPAKLYVVHGSHPCAAVRRALELKGIDYKLVEFPPPMHMLALRPMFGGRTVPAIRFEDGTKLQGSRPIMQRLDELVAEPRLYGDPRVDEAEAWAEETLQPIARTVLWSGFARRPAAMVGYQEGGKLPPLPAPVVRALAPAIVRAERRANEVDDERLRSELAALPGHLDRIDGWIAKGVVGGEQPNAADLQIASTLRLLMTVADLRPIVADRPAGRLALRLFPQHPGEVPAGTYPADWLPAAVAPVAA